MYDDYLASLGPGTTGQPGLGLRPHAVVQGTAGFVHAGNKTREHWKAMNASLMSVPGASENPASYSALASHMFQWAARYGSNPHVDQSLLRLAPNQKPVVGAGLQPWLEVLNEPDGWWAGREAYYSPLEYAAALSAAYDGHEGTMGPGIGIKAADPSLKVSQGGQADLPGNTTELQAMEAMALWAQSNRKDGKFPADALNLHHYSTNTTTGWDGQGITPEQDGLLDLAQSFGTWRDARAPHAELWWTEYGYDTNGGPQSAPGIGSLTPQEVQGGWLVRTALLMGASGAVQRAHMYMLADVSSQGHGKYSTSGLLTDRASQCQRKAGWYYVSAFHWWVGGLAVTGIQEGGHRTMSVGGVPTMISLQRVGTLGQDLVGDRDGLDVPNVRGGVAVWLPSSTGASLPGQAVQLPPESPAPGASVLVVRMANL